MLLVSGTLILLLSGAGWAGVGTPALSPTSAPGTPQSRTSASPPAAQASAPARSTGSKTPPRFPGVQRSRQTIAPAQVRMSAGRAQLHGPGGTRQLAAGSRHSIEGAALLELGWGDLAEISWNGQASVRVSGPASFEWAPPWIDGSQLGWRVDHARRLDVEVRRGPLHLELPGCGWVVVAGPGAFRVEDMPAGALRLEHRAGVALDVHSLIALPAGERSRFNIPQGKAIRLRAIEPVLAAPAKQRPQIDPRATRQR